MSNTPEMSTPRASAKTDATVALMLPGYHFFQSSNFQATFKHYAGPVQEIELDRRDFLMLKRCLAIHGKHAKDKYIKAFTLDLLAYDDWGNEDGNEPLNASLPQNYRSRYWMQRAV